MARRFGNIVASFAFVSLFLVRGTGAQYDSCTNDPVTDIGNGRCDAALNVPACGFDGGDCCPCTCSDGPTYSCSDNIFDCLYPICGSPVVTSEETATSVETVCDQDFLSDGFCDSTNNHLGCSWDGGDCCKCSCVSTDDFYCGTQGFKCLDPGCFNPAVVAEFPDCTGDWLSIGDGTCNTENNNAACDYDGGDCCSCSCEGLACSSSLIDCLDPSAGDEFYECELSPSVLPCSEKVKKKWVVADMHQARALAAAVRCSGGAFDVEWRGNVVVDEPIYVIDGTVLTVSGADTGAVIDGNKATRLFVVVNATLHVSNINLTSGTGIVGGAIAAVGSVLTLVRANFIGNSATSNGGAMFISGGSNVTCVGGAVRGNSADTHGGAVYSSESSMVFYDTLWIHNFAGYNGGGVYLTSESTIAWRGTEFIGNDADGSGGAMFLQNGSSGTIEDGNFTSNTAGGDGGVVGSAAFDSLTNPASSVLVIAGVTTFANNSCLANGGVMAFLGGLSIDIRTVDARFLYNEAAVAGGAVFVSGTGVGPEFVDLSFVSNSAEVGGAVSIVVSGKSKTAADNAEATRFDRCRFVNNRAMATGGAVESAAGHDAFVNSVFEGNMARGGGALRLAGTTDIYNCSFVENVSDDGEGAAVSNIGSITRMKKLSFSRNVFDCPPGMYLGYSSSGDAYTTVCNGCRADCKECSFDERDMVPVCTDVIAHASSAGGTTTLETLSIEEGFWRATNSSPRVQACYNANACLGGVTGTANYCADGYDGPYCAICKESYTAGIGFTCSECPDSIGDVVLAAVLGVVALFTVVAVVSYVVSGGGVGGGNIVIGRLTQYVPLQSVKIIVVTWQILTQFTSVANVTYPEVYQRFLDSIYVVSFDLGWVLSAGCVVDVDFHDRLLISTIAPVIFLLLLGGTSAAAAKIHRGATGTLQDVWHKHVSMVLFLTFFVYSGVSSIVFETFTCEDLEDGTTKLRADYRIECDSMKHKAAQVYAGFMIVLYAAGIPAFYSILLFRDRKLLVNDQAGREDSSRITAISDLWEPYKPSVFYYEVIECARRILLTGVVVFIYPNTVAQIAVTLMMAIVFAIVSEALAPYASRWDAWASRFGHAVVYVSMYLALLLKVDVSEEPDESQRVFEVLLVIAHVAMVLVAVVESFALVCSYRVEKRTRFGLGKNLRRRVDAASTDFFPADDVDEDGRPRVD